MLHGRTKCKNNKEELIYFICQNILEGERKDIRFRIKSEIGVANFFMDDVSNLFQRIQLTIENATPDAFRPKTDEIAFSVSIVKTPAAKELIYPFHR